MKKRMLAVFLGIFIFMNFFNVYALSEIYPGWVKEENYWKLKYKDGSYFKSGWFHDLTTDIWYYVKDDGCIISEGKTPEGYNMSRSGRLIDKEEMYKTMFGNKVPAEYINEAFKFKVYYSPNAEVRSFGAQKKDEPSDFNMDGGINIKIDDFYFLTVCAGAYTVGIPQYDKVEDFVTFSGLRGKLYTQYSNERVYINLILGPTGQEVLANVSGGLYKEAYERNKDKIYKMMKAISKIE